MVRSLVHHQLETVARIFCVVLPFGRDPPTPNLLIGSIDLIKGPLIPQIHLPVFSLSIIIKKKINIFQEREQLLRMNGTPCLGPEIFKLPLFLRENTKGADAVSEIRVQSVGRETKLASPTEGSSCALFSSSLFSN